MEILRAKAHAKLNLSLDVLSGRTDGYHDLCMIMQSVALHDDLAISLNRTGEFAAQTNRSYLPNDERNIALKAAKLFLRETGNEQFGAFIMMRKRIPVCAGLGGGSSDAAAVLRALNRFFKTGLTQTELEEMGLKLGSDVPYCIAGGTMLAEGRGEILTPLAQLTETDVVICKPNFPISTPELFGRIDSRTSRCRPDTVGIVNAIAADDKRALGQRLYNVFEDVLDRRARDINAIKSTLLSCGAYGACMSGTGSAVFGIFPDSATARDAGNALSQLHRETFITKTIGALTHM